MAQHLTHISQVAILVCRECSVKRSTPYLHGRKECRMTRLLRRIIEDISLHHCLAMCIFESILASLFCQRRISVYCAFQLSVLIVIYGLSSKSASQKVDKTVGKHTHLCVFTQESVHLFPPHVINFLTSFHQSHFLQELSGALHTSSANFLLKPVVSYVTHVCTVCIGRYILDAPADILAN